MTVEVPELSFLPQRLDLDVYQGDLISFGIRLRSVTWDEDQQKWVAGDWIDLSGTTVKAQVRKTKASTALTAEFTCTPNPDQALNKGRCQLVMLPAVTAGIAAGKYVWDCQLESSPENIRTRLAGIFKVSGDTTE